MKHLFFLIVAAYLITPNSFAETGSEPFSVKGERIDITPPAGWKLAWMKGKSDGEYLAEYIKDGEDVSSWKSGLLLIRRAPYPSVDIREQIYKLKAKVADVGLVQLANQTKQICKEKYVPTAQRVNTFGGLYFSVGGWYCGLAGPSIPYGEGSYVAFIEGKDFIHIIQYSWRPQTDVEVKASPWAIEEKTATAYLQSITSAVICDEDKNNCSNPYTR
ncbi:MAG: hypothetical protein FP821_06635 [Sideroxydans sp.]|nr:hypothetical protein [Sideroxydans sp.]